ncbi:MAG: TIGR01212 family radical SAM protein [Bacteroidaceae bacterium]|nr:TIGR01212 family radical SAM protein [Bacteroidaceae bacterium]
MRMNYDFGKWLASQVGCKAQKISVNAGFTCPNRDGSIGTGGCTYCNNQTFNPEYCATGKTIRQQLEEGKAFFGRKYPDMKYLAYFQAYTNTYADLATLRERYEEALGVDDVVGLVIGTRPDCMPTALLDYLEELSHRTFVLVEYGIESVYDRTLRRINRGHDFDCTRRAVIATAERGIRVGGHVIMGLPGETVDDMLGEAEILSALPLTTLKLHQLQLIKGTRMADEYREHPEDFVRFTADEYAELIVRFVSLSRPDMVFERFVSQSPPDLLAEPGWGLKNYEFMELVKRKMKG